MHGWATDRRRSTASKFSHATDAMRSSVILSVVRQVTALACLVACSGGSEVLRLGLIAGDLR